MSTPRECPRCGGPNVKASTREGSRKPRESGVLLLRRKRCLDCGFEGGTAEFWVQGEYLSSLAAELAGRLDAVA